MSIEATFKNFCEELGIPCASLFAFRNGEETFLNFGQNPISQQTVTEKSIFDLASVTKLFTATAMLQLIERGECHLGDAVQKYIPELLRNDITIQDLFTHTVRGDIYLSKLREETDNPKEFKKKILEAGKMYDKEYFYQCQNYMMLGWIIEKITGMGLNDFMKENIFEPLEMWDTTFSPKEKERCVPTFFDEHDSVYLQGVVHDPNARLLGGAVGNAGIFTTTSDMAHFMKMWLLGGKFLGKKLLREETVALALQKFYENPRGNFAQGLGWKLHTTHVDAEKILDGAWMHMGYTGTIVLFDKERDFVMILLTNIIYPTGEWVGTMRAQFRDHLRMCIESFLE